MKHIGGYEDITPGRTADGVEALKMRVFHIIDTPPGALPQDPEWGWGLAQYIGEPVTDADIRLLAQIGRAAFRRDPEVHDATVEITVPSPGVARVNARLQTRSGIVDIERDIG